jgi:hypothetical protein
LSVIAVLTLAPVGGLLLVVVAGFGFTFFGSLLSRK